MIKEKTKKRCIEVANYFLETGETQTQIANKFNISKGMVSILLNTYLPQVDMELYKRVQQMKEICRKEQYEKIQPQVEKGNMEYRQKAKAEHDKRVIEMAKYFLSTEAYASEIASKFNCSIATVSKALNKELKEIDPKLYKRVQLRKM